MGTPAGSGRLPEYGNIADTRLVACKGKKRVGLIVKDVQWVHSVEFLCYQMVDRVILMNAHLVIGRLAGESCMCVCECVWAWDVS